MHEIVQVFKYSSKRDSFVFINVAAYLSEKEIESLIEYIGLNQLSVLILEPRKVYNFPQFILDKDYFFKC